MGLFRTKPGNTRYVEAVFDDHTKQYFVKEVDPKTGQGRGPVETHKQADFEDEFEAAKRLPTNKKPKAAA